MANKTTSDLCNTRRRKKKALNTIPKPPSIGSILWRAESGAYRVSEVCPVCCGKLAIVVILGDGTPVGVDCDYCGRGFNGPQGVEKVWKYSPRAVEFAVTELISYDADRGWVVRTTDGATEYAKALWATEAEALTASQQAMQNIEARNMESRNKPRKAERLKMYGWTVGYHKRCLADLQRQVAWHTSKMK